MQVATMFMSCKESGLLDGFYSHDDNHDFLKSLIWKMLNFLILAQLWFDTVTEH